MISSENIEAVLEMQSEIEEHENRIDSLLMFQSTFLRQDYAQDGDYLISYKGRQYMATFVDSVFMGLASIDKVICSE